MKKISALLFLFFPLFLFAQNVFFEKSLDSALSKAKADDKILLIKFYSDT